MTEDAESMAYVGILPCGCVVAAAVDGPLWKKDTAKTISKWIKAGMTIERKPCQWVRGNLKSCQCSKSSAQAPALKQLSPRLL